MEPVTPLGEGMEGPAQGQGGRMIGPEPRQDVAKDRSRHLEGLQIAHGVPLLLGGAEDLVYRVPQRVQLSFLVLGLAG